MLAFILLVGIVAIPHSSVANSSNTPALISNAGQPVGIDVCVEGEAVYSTAPGEYHEPSGVKGWLVKKATRLLAAAIRHGGDSVAYVLKYLDRKAARAFRKHAKAIADELDRIARIPDLTTRIVKEKLEVFLRVEVGLSGGTALQIADAVKAALDILLF